MKNKYSVTISLGSNVVNGHSNIQKAIDIIGNKFYLKKVSKIYKTEPFGNLNQPPFFNAIIIIETTFLPIKLLNILKKVEKKFNQKKKSQFWGKRIIDLDILYFEDFEIVSNKLIIPHEGVYNREYIKQILSTISENKLIK